MCATVTGSMRRGARGRSSGTIELVLGELRPGGAEREWCHPEVLRRLRRPRSRCCARRSSRSTSAHSRDSCPPGRGSTATPRRAPASTACATCSSRFRGWRCPPRSGSATSCRAGSAPIHPPGWTNCPRPASSSGSAPGRSVAAPGGSRSTSARTWRCWGRRPAAGGRGGRGSLHEPLRERLERGACFFSDLLVAFGEVSGEELQEALWDLVWAGEVTNDAFAPLRAPRLVARATSAAARAPAGRAPRPEVLGRGARYSGRARLPIQGRWSLTAPLLGAGTDPAGPPAGAVRAAARALRHPDPRAGAGRRACRVASAAIYSELTQLETLGVARRGYFVEGLGGAQFALPGAVERLREQRTGSEPPVVLSAVDPAQPYGAALRGPYAKATAGARPLARPAPLWCSPAASRSSTWSEAAGR